MSALESQERDSQKEWSVSTLEKTEITKGCALLQYNNLNDSY